MNTFDEILKKLENAEKIAIFSHENPDGDAIGSMCAAKAILNHMGKSATICFNTEPPEKFSYLLDDYEVMPHSVFCDAALALDCGALKRLGALSELYEKAPLKLSVDHHLSSTPFADFYYTDHTAAANCELIYDMAKALCGEVPQKAMEAIYTGLSTDTGHFKFSNVTKKTMSIAAELIGLGLNHRKITEIVYDTVKKEKLKFLGEIYTKIEFMADGEISYLYCSNDLMSKYGIEFSDIEELPNTILSIEGVKVAILLKDKEDGGYKASMRGRDVCDLAAIASCYGGGGHKNAAGLSISESIEAFIPGLVEKVQTALKEADL